MSDETPTEVATAATNLEALPLDGTALIGIIDGPGGTRAMLRFADGGIDTVQAGDLTSAGRVVALDTKQVVLNDQGRTTTLRMPTG